MLWCIPDYRMSGVLSVSAAGQGNLQRWCSIAPCWQSVARKPGDGSLDELLGDKLNGYFGGYDEETIRRRSFCCVCGNAQDGGWLSLAVSTAYPEGLWMPHSVIMKHMREEDNCSKARLETWWAAAQAAGKTVTACARSKDLVVASLGELPRPGSPLAPDIPPMVMSSIPTVFFFIKLTSADMLAAERQMAQAKEHRNRQERAIMSHNRIAALAMAEKNAMEGVESGSVMME